MSPWVAHHHPWPSQQLLLLLPLLVTCHSIQHQLIRPAAQPSQAAGLLALLPAASWI